MQIIGFAKLSFALALVATMSGCFLTKILPESKKKKKQKPAPAEESEPEATIAEPPQISLTRMVRRIALDLTGNLPSPGDVARIKENPDNLTALISNYTETAEARAAITSLHRNIWRLSSEHLPELDRFTEEGDTTLTAALTGALREEIIKEPLLRLRYILDTNRPFTDLFSGTWTILHPDLIALYELEDDQAPWPHEIYRFADYQGRPAVGLLITNALLASESNSHQEVPQHRTSRILQRFNCTNNAQHQAHTFALTADELANLDTHARLRSPCRGCHALWGDIAESFSGLGTGDDFSTWLTYTGNTESAGLWSGKSFTDSSELGDLIGNDPRVHQCELTRLTAALLQRPITPYDSPLIAQTADEFYKNSLRLMPALPPILRSKDYRYDAVPPDANIRYLRTASGVRFLRPHHWRNIIRQFTHSGDISVSDSIDAGNEEFVTSEDQIPSGGYWYTVDRTARSLAIQIVKEELTETRSANSRRLLTLLPDGKGIDANDATIQQQIVAAWELLTNEDIIDINTKPLSEFLDLWSNLETQTDEQFQQAWATILTAMLSHPTFLRY